MYQHFRAIAKHVDLPIVLYNVPGRTGVSIQPETIKRIVDDRAPMWSVSKMLQATGTR